MESVSPARLPLPAMLASTRELLRHLFVEDQLPLWEICHPVPLTRGTSRPPPSAATYHYRVCDPLLPDDFQVAVKNYSRTLARELMKFFRRRIRCTTPSFGGRTFRDFFSILVRASPSAEATLVRQRFATIC